MINSRWYKDAIIYQIYPLSFCDSNGDGIGDINGITSKLDYLADLGINCVWLSPVYLSPMEDNGYDISDYKAINPIFGTMEDFERMLKEMHKRGIKLVMDLVMNHTSKEHKWFMEASQNKNSPYHDYYIFKKGRKNNTLPPNNWTGFFGEGAWEYNAPTEDWYLHLFAKGQIDVNWENPKLRSEFKEIIKFWCDKGVDGFRCDVINAISKEQSFQNGHELLFLKGKKYYINGPRLHEFLKEINQDVLSHYDVMTVGETVMSNLEDMKKLAGEERGELSMIFNFDHTSVDNFFGVKWFMRKFKLTRWKNVLSYYQYGFDKDGWNSLFYENHDQRRSVGRFNTSDTKYRKESAKMLATSMYFLKGTPFIYEGQEIGMTNSDIKELKDFKDVETFNIYKTAQKLHLPKSYLKKTIWNGTRDNARTPMQWDDTKNAGFTIGTPWLKVNDNKSYINVEESKNDPDSIFNYYKKIIALRKKEELVKTGTYHLLLKNDKYIYAYERVGEKEKLLVLANYSEKERKLKLKLSDYEVLINNYSDFGKTLKPYQAVVLKMKK